MSSVTSSLRRTLFAAPTSRILRPAQCGLRAFSVSSAMRNTPSGQDTFYTTPSTLDVKASVLGEPTAKTISQWQAGLWARLESEMQTNPKLSDYMARQRSLHPSGKLSMTDLLSFLARDPTLSLPFNYASLLLNTSFFLEGLVKDSAALQAVPSGYAGLEDQLVAQARGMVGSGWLWIVSYDRKITTIPTYGSGTVLVRNRSQQGRDGMTPLFYPATPASATSAASSTEQPANNAPRMDREEDEQHNFVIGSDYKPIKPLAVINLFEHAYLARHQSAEGGLDVWGKEQWVRDWFKMVDWAQVKSRAS